MAHILLIEDDMALVDVLRGLLVKRGHAVDAAGTGAEGRALCTQHVYDLVVVDGLLPDGRGSELIKGLRAGGLVGPILFMSTSAAEVATVRSRTEELGVVRVLRKPLDPATFPLEVSHALTHGRDATQQVSQPDSGAEALLSAAIEQFRVSLAARVEAFGAALSVARTSPEPTGLAGLHAEAHKLHGTAGSFGFQQVSADAEVIESALAPVVRSGAVLDTGAWGRIDAAFVSMADSVVGPSVAQQPVVVRGRASILVVEDDELLVSALRDELAHAFDVFSTADSAQALEMVRATRPVCVFIDVHLRERFEGLELTKAIRASPSISRLPIALLSADSALETQVAGIHAGASLFLNKPVTATMMVETVRRLTESWGDRCTRVVVLDEDLAFGAAVREALIGLPIDVRCLADEAQLLETLSHDKPSLLLLDMALRRTSGLDICRTLRANPKWEDLDVVLVTSDPSMEMRIAAFRAGASDYVTKPVVPQELLARITARIERRALLDERSTRDNLTGLLIRGAFVEAFDRTLTAARRAGTPVSVCLLDLDHFKQVNDHHGHVAGDRVLAQLGQLLLHRFRTEDLRCRWGGEEIVLTLAGCPAAEAKLALERLLEEFRNITFDEGDTGPFSVTFSAGVASFPRDGGTLHELIAAADERMYAGKRLGRARVLAKS